jgi:Domain of unknown function (DUF4149)/Late embryogenesis abundant protein
MMNLLALALVVSTLTAAGVLTPPVNPSHQKLVSDQVLRECHRIIVLEHERQFPADTGTGVSNGEGGDTVKELSEPAKDKVCDAFGVCRDKLSGAASGVEHAIGGAKDKLSGLFPHGKDKLSDAQESMKGAKEKVEDAKDAAENKLFQVKEATKDKASEAKDAATSKLSEASDATKDKLSQAKEVTKDKLSQAGEKVVDMTIDAKESAENKLSQAKGGIEDKVSEAKGKIGDKLANAENTIVQAKEKPRERLSEMGEEVKDKASHLKEEVKEKKMKAGDIADETVQNLTDIVRRARDVAYDMASYVSSPRTSHVVWAVIQLLGFVTAYGTCVWVTFISSHVLASALPRQQFGMVQSKVYPAYFRAIAYGILVAFLAQSFGRGKANMAEKFQAYNLLGALCMVVVNMFFLEPIGTKVCLF